MKNILTIKRFIAKISHHKRLMMRKYTIAIRCHSNPYKYSARKLQEIRAQEKANRATGLTRGGKLRMGGEDTDIAVPDMRTKKPMAARRGQIY